MLPCGCGCHCTLQLLRGIHPTWHYGNQGPRARFKVFTWCSQAVGDIVVGSVLGPSSQRANESRIAMFLAGFPETVPVRTVNRCCTVRRRLHRTHHSVLSVCKELAAVSVQGYMVQHLQVMFVSCLSLCQ